ncbi:hypothetical protein SEVIR_2G271800v4 [Setaria viridis]|uniref:MTD1 n=2 Tax=Setaria TaxID=4554 RepID=A0A368Q2S8_SETIT|nr:uncharacterized protein LOC101756298 [Setaria italica]XP_034583021.1 uncharacterized protein LOC117846031 [Setaria viridis]RCV12341.1 hypothetical protein SETIT_2G261500v2 [Setaria italica]TKW33940.1 hypothetical protein SEVIR_2G271800v2 [Setaria viridis]
MSTAVAEVRPAYGFPGSGKRSAGEQAAVLAAGKRRSDGFFIEEDEAEEEVLTETSSLGAPSPSGSSIGENSSSEAGGEDGEEEEVESKLKEGDALGCLDALEDSLPIKKGLSSFYAGKSKSFTSLAEATSTVAEAKELAKPENPFNKRRRILANWSRRASCSSLATATYLPPLLAPDHAVAEGDEGEEDDSDDDEEECNQLPHRGKNIRGAPALPLPPPRLLGVGMQRRNGLGSFRSPRSFSLSDLQNSRIDGSD